MDGRTSEEPHKVKSSTLPLNAFTNVPDVVIGAACPSGNRESILQ